MKKSILLMIGLLATSNAFSAEYATGIVSGYNIGSDNWVGFGTTTPLPGTCSYFTDQFRFDASTALGKNMLTTLLAAKATGLRLRVWYTASTAPGTNHTNGCTYSTMAVIGGIGVE